MITLAVDCMGGDHGPRVTLAACRQFLDNHPDAHLLLVGLKESLQSFSHERATVVLTTEVVTMDDPVEIALRRKKDSSMRVAIQQVKDGTAAAAVSAGNTGALMAIARCTTALLSIIVMSMVLSCRVRISTRSKAFKAIFFKMLVSLLSLKMDDIQSTNTTAASTVV